MAGMYFQLFAAIALIIFLIWFKRSLPKWKGSAGERRIAGILSRLPKDEYITINDLLLPNKYGSTTQIDHVVVSLYGIYVIETKNYKGWITGQEFDDYWTQTIFYTKNQLRNPIRQNYGHIKAIEALVPEQIPVISVVVFTNRANLKVQTRQSNLIYVSQLKRCIRNSAGQQYISATEMRSIADIILSHNITSKATRKEHVKTLKRRYR